MLRTLSNTIGFDVLSKFSRTLFCGTRQVCVPSVCSSLPLRLCGPLIAGWVFCVYPLSARQCIAGFSAVPSQTYSPPSTLRRLCWSSCGYRRQVIPSQRPPTRRKLTLPSSRGFWVWNPLVPGFFGESDTACQPQDKQHCCCARQPPCGCFHAVEFVGDHSNGSSKMSLASIQWMAA